MRSAKHVDRVRRIRALAKLLDTAFVIPGTGIRFGLDSLVGLIPGIGDAATGLVGAYIVAEAINLGVPKTTVLRMSWNLGVDMAVGTIPVLGDVFDVAFKAHNRNVKLLEKHLHDVPPAR